MQDVIYAHLLARTVQRTQPEMSEDEFYRLHAEPLPRWLKWVSLLFKWPKSKRGDPKIAPIQSKLDCNRPFKLHGGQLPVHPCGTVRPGA